MNYQVAIAIGRGVVLVKHILQLIVAIESTHTTILKNIYKNI